MTTDELVDALYAIGVQAGGDGRVELIVSVGSVKAPAYGQFRLFISGPGGHQEPFESSTSIDDVLSKAKAALPVPT